MDILKTFKIKKETENVNLNVLIKNVQELSAKIKSTQRQCQTNLKLPFWTSKKSLFTQPKDETHLSVAHFWYGTFYLAKQDLWTENFFVNLFIIMGHILLYISRREMRHFLSSWIIKLHVCVLRTTHCIQAIPWNLELWRALKTGRNFLVLFREVTRRNEGT